jgi:hypothetical protein
MQIAFERRTISSAPIELKNARGSRPAPIPINFISYRFSISKHVSLSTFSTSSPKTILRYFAGQTK